MKIHVRRGKAFSLVELLVVIGIIAVLIGILLPALNKAKESARAVVCASNMRQWGLAFNMYCQGSKGVLPIDGDTRFQDTDGDRTSRPLGVWDSNSLWINGVPPFVSQKRYFDLQQSFIDGKGQLAGSGAKSIFVCPSATEAIPNKVGQDVVTNGLFIMYGWAAGAVIPDPASYGPPPGTPVSVGRPTFFCYVMNSKLNGTRTGTGNTLVRLKKLSQLRPASEVVLMIEKRVQPREVPSNVNDTYSTMMDTDLRGVRIARMKADWQRFSGRHRDGGYILFADGHVQLYSMKEVTIPRKPHAVDAEFNQPGKIIWDPYAEGAR